MSRNTGATDIVLSQKDAERVGIETGVDFYKVMDAAEQVVEPLMHRPQVINNDGLMLGYAGVYSRLRRYGRINSTRQGLL